MKGKTVASVTLVFFMMFAICDMGNHLHMTTAILFAVFGVGFMFYAIWRRWGQRRW